MAGEREGGIRKEDRKLKAEVVLASCVEQFNFKPKLVKVLYFNPLINPLHEI